MSQFVVNQTQTITLLQYLLSCGIVVDQRVAHVAILV